MMRFRSKEPFLVNRSCGLVQLRPRSKDCSIQMLASASALERLEEAGCWEWNRYTTCRREGTHQL